MLKRITTIEELNQDALLDDVKILWTGQTVSLLLNNKVLTTFTATADLQDKILRWCLKNSYRCTQMHDGKIWL